ncbi:MAG: aminotransferase class V-fold PLP-dependent enzyme [Chloroflexi bacterium]|nr:aminotransferase class V-fold PLP-dependent enzyme [Ardenticatenaceae bacterium]MBL1130629.1 aminotransferase class V-fold PLP-dependent enzyme [Chloroflexota bacterium]NOG36723.1 aminotransferase class V-fold PLP-dependent enzyme [Chloroflexota bacterium]GIK56765.1 MAG: aminotransferase V [Chloroflexota bacterium]
MYNVEQLRADEFPGSSETLYFNHAGISPLPARTQAKVKWAIDEFARQPSRFWMKHGLDYAERLRQGMAAFLNAASPWEIVPSATTSAGLNAVAQAMAWQPGDNVVFCDVEFPSNVYPWLSLAREGVESRLVPAMEGGLTLAALQPYVNDRTRVVAASAIQFFTGQRTDLTAVGRFCHERGILFVVDAIQAIGHMPIDVQAMHIDVLACGGQKSLLALPGQGFLYVRQELAEQMQPRAIGSNATVDYLHWLKYNLTPAPAAQRFMAGTPNIPGIIAMVESLGLLRELGVENIDRHTRELSDRATAVLTNLGYRVISPQPVHGPIVTFAVDVSSAEADALVAALARQHVALVKHLDKEGHAYLRVSFHCYNTMAEIEQFGGIMQEMGGR